MPLAIVPVAALKAASLGTSSPVGLIGNMALRTGQEYSLAMKNPGSLGEEIAIRKCSGTEEFAACVALQKEVWNFSDADLVPLRMFVVADKIGGQVIGASDRIAAAPVDRPISCAQVAASVYNAMGLPHAIHGIDAAPIPLAA